MPEVLLAFLAGVGAGAVGMYGAILFECALWRLRQENERWRR